MFHPLINISSVQYESYDTHFASQDGFFNLDLTTLPTPYIGYVVPADALFGVLDAILSLDLTLSGLLEWRYVTLDDDVAALQPGDLSLSTEWAALEAITITEVPDDWRKQFLDIERICKDAGGFPHAGKYFGMGEDEQGIIRPFQSVGPEDLNSEAQKQAFRAYAASVDPDGVFRSGFMADYLFEPTSAALFK